MTKERKYLAVVDLQTAEWTRATAAAAQAGSNFLLLIPCDSGQLDEFCRQFQLPPSKLPKPMRRANLYLLSPHIDAQVFDRLLAALDEGCRICFMEQLDLPGTQPPNVKRFLVYCSIWGIISQHDDFRDAGNAWSDYVQSLSLQQSNPEAGIYKWTGDRWCSVEV